MLQVSPGILNIYIVNIVEVPVPVEIMENAPKDDYSNWDHVVEASIDVPSGVIVVADLITYTPQAQFFPITPGCWRARVYFGALNKIFDRLKKGMSITELYCGQQNLNLFRF